MLLIIGSILYVVALVGLSFRSFVWVLEQFPPVEQPPIVVSYKLGRSRLLDVLFFGGLVVGLTSVVLLFLVKWYLALVSIPVWIVATRLLVRLLIVILLAGNRPGRAVALKILSGEIEAGLFEDDNDLARIIGPASSGRFEKQLQVLKELDGHSHDESEHELRDDWGEEGEEEGEEDSGDWDEDEEDAWQEDLGDD